MFLQFVGIVDFLSSCILVLIKSEQGFNNLVNDKYAGMWFQVNYHLMQSHRVQNKLTLSQCQWQTMQYMLYGSLHLLVPVMWILSHDFEITERSFKYSFHCKSMIYEYDVEHIFLQFSFYGKQSVNFMKTTFKLYLYLWWIVHHHNCRLLHQSFNPWLGEGYSIKGGTSNVALNWVGRHLVGPWKVQDISPILSFLQ